MQTLLLILIAVLLIGLLCMTYRLLKISDKIHFEVIRLGWELALSGNLSFDKQGNNGGDCCDSGKN